MPAIFESLYPDHYFSSTYRIPFEKLYEEGYRGIIFDIDNTLVEHGAPADARSVELFLRLRGIGYGTVILSNNKEPRVKLFSDAVGSGYIYKAAKPSAKNYRKAMTMMGTDRSDTLFVGDQIFTDVWGARRASLLTYLVRPIDKKEEIQIVLKRFLEKVVLYFYKRKCKRENKVFMQESE